MASFSGRMINLMSRRLPGMMHRATRRQVGQYRSTKGGKGNTTMGKPVFLLDVIGRKSGESRPVMLMLVRQEDSLLVVGSYGGNPRTPNWYENLMAAGEAHVEVGAERWAVTARQLDEGQEHEAAWDLCVAAYPDFASYQELTDRRIPVAALSRKDD